jgi:hypothetical protein
MPGRPVSTMSVVLVHGGTAVHVSDFINFYVRAKSLPQLQEMTGLDVEAIEAQIDELRAMGVTITPLAERWATSNSSPILLEEDW